MERRSSLSRHIHSNHETIDVTLCKAKIKNENFLLHINLYTDQIKFLNKPILIQDHNLGVNDRPTSESVGFLTPRATLPEIHYGGG